jgi:hypothetical protein
LHTENGHFYENDPPAIAEGRFLRLYCLYWMERHLLPMHRRKERMR